MLEISDHNELLKTAITSPQTINSFQSELTSIELGNTLSHNSYIYNEPLKGEAGTKIDLWLLPNKSMPDFLEASELLPTEEQSHAEKITHKPYKTRHLATRILTRLALTKAAGKQISPDQWKIKTNPFGKPELVPGQSNLSFSISHTNEFSALTITTDTTIGIDIEILDPAILPELPLAVLSHNEVRHIEHLSGDEEYKAFMTLWTLKEAYSKAKGVGFSLDFENHEFSLTPLAHIKNGYGNNTEQETFKLLTVTHHDQPYILTICTIDNVQPSLTS